MNVKVLFFGVLNDVLGKDKMDFSLEDGAPVSKFKSSLLEAYPQLEPYGFSIAVNETYCNSEFQLEDGHVIALIPPVSGG